MTVSSADKLRQGIIDSSVQPLAFASHGRLIAPQGERFDNAQTGLRTSQAQIPSPSRVNIIFYSEWLPKEASTKDGNVEVVTLTHGQSYTLEVAAGEASASDEKHYVIDKSQPAKLILEPLPPDAGVEIDTCCHVVCYEHVESSEGLYRFQINVAHDCPTGDYSLVLQYSTPKRIGPKHTDERHEVGRWQVHVEGTRYELDKNLLSELNLDLTPPPKNIAFLHINSKGETNQLVFKGMSSYLPLEGAASVEAPRIGLPRFGDKQVGPEDIRAGVTEFSRKLDTKISGWLKHLRKCAETAGDELCLVIVDYTNTEFPWEMLSLGGQSANKDDYDFLGASVTVVRWISVWAYGPVKLGYQETSKEGAALTYLSENLSATVHELYILDPYSEGAGYYTTADAIKERLKEPLQDIALVYMGCHGIFTPKDPDAIGVGGLQNPHGGTVIELDFEEGFQEGSRIPLIFANACHSGRVVHRDDRRAYGLAEVFLARLTYAYIGTLGAVEDQVASGIAARLLNEAASEQGLHAASMLRDLRREVVKEYLANKSDEKLSKENLSRLINTFMYAYFGNPRVTVRLVARQQTG